MLKWKKTKKNSIGKWAKKLNTRFHAKQFLLEMEIILKKISCEYVLVAVESDTRQRNRKIMPFWSFSRSFSSVPHPLSAYFLSLIVNVCLQSILHKLINALICKLDLRLNFIQMSFNIPFMILAYSFFIHAAPSCADFVRQR